MRDNDFEEIVKEYLKPVYNFVARVTDDTAEAHDVTQEVFVKAWKNLKKFNPQSSFKTWILSIARNAAIDWLRRKKNISFSDLDSDENFFEDSIKDPEPLPDEIFLRKELVAELEKALGEIRPEFREIIILHDIEDMTFQEISEIAGKSLNTVKSQYRRALHQIRLQLRI